MDTVRLPRTLGQLRQHPEYNENRIGHTTVKDELRRNLIRKIQNREPLFPGIIGYEDTVLPQLVNAILARHNFILLGLRGQAKTKILRMLTSLLDPQIPYVAGCEIRDNPYRPICKRCRDWIAEQGDETPIAWLTPEERYVEKLATPDVTIADIIGDVDPIKAARGGHELSSELTIHYGLLPRANRGIFAVNELPDLAAKIQVGLFNIMQEGDVQIKGYPVRLPLDVVLVFTANPEDYTARGKIITPLKDRIGSEIRTHYPLTIEHGMAITQQEAWTDRPSPVQLHIPGYVRQVIETIAFLARQDKKIDQRSGVSQRMPITVLEIAVSNAERRALLTGESIAVVRIQDVYAALPAITGKIELEYEGEMQGGEQVARQLIRSAVGQVFDEHFETGDLSAVVQWFELGGVLKLEELLPSTEALRRLEGIQGLLEATAALGVRPDSPPAARVAAAEFILEGLWARKRISRNEEQEFVAARAPIMAGPLNPNVERRRGPLN